MDNKGNGGIWVLSTSKMDDYRVVEMGQDNEEDDDDDDDDDSKWDSFNILKSLPSSMSRAPLQDQCRTVGSR